MLRVLDESGNDYLLHPQKLKYLLCPLVAQNEVEQERFYAVFDRFLAEAMPAPEPVTTLPPRKSWWQRIPKWVKWTLAALSALALLLFFFSGFVLGGMNQPLFSIEPQGESWQVGDTVFFKNKTHEFIDTAGLRYRWELRDVQTGEVEFSDSSNYHVQWVAGRGKGGWQKTMSLQLSGDLRLLDSLQPKRSFPVLFVINQNTLNENTTLPFTVTCPNPPHIDSLFFVERTEVDKEITLSAAIHSEKGKPLQLTWYFGDGDSLTLSENKPVKHIWQRNGTFGVVLTARLPDDEGECQHTFDKVINVGSDKATLALKPLWKDTAKPNAKFAIGTWILLSLLGLGMIWHWVKWASRKAPAAVSNIPNSEFRIPHSNKAPYFIPFQAKDGVIRVEREMFRIADLLRRRQKGLRQEMDIPASLRATTEGGGFPRLLTSTVTVPAEYLFLLDEQSVSSHQARLFERMVVFLKQRDIYAELFRYKTDFQRFWNPQHPQGIGAGQLRRMFPMHRLIVLGDAHALIAPQNTGKPRLRPDAEDLLPTWKRRLLLTPQPPVSWTYREAVLHDWFGVFPADLEGISDAMEHLDIAHEDDAPVAFANWQQSQVECRPAEPTLAYRRWRTADDHEAYLKNQPKLFLWLCAAAIYPKPVWALTLAVGQALEPLGVRVTHDNLLILSRIPWLQSGDLSPELRLELLACLTPEAERLAREAIRHELQTAQPAAAEGFANRELQVNLAVQNVSIEPQNEEYQQAVRALIAVGLLTEEQLEELNESLRRQSVLEPEEDVQAFLEKEKEPPKKPFYTKNFKWACWLTTIFLALYITVWRFDGTEALYRGTFREEPVASTECKERHYLFVREICWADSAVWYNNKGVDAYRSAFGLNGEENVRRAVIFNDSTQSLIFGNFSRASTLRQPDGYPLAAANEGKVWFNAAAERYNLYLQEAQDTGFLRQAMGWFRQAARYDSTALDALHGMGLAHFYQWEANPAYLETPGEGLQSNKPSPNRQSNKPPQSRQSATQQERLPADSALHYYRLLLERTDSLFFDTTSVFPNLETLLFPPKTSYSTDLIIGGCARIDLLPGYALKVRKRALTRPETDSINLYGNSNIAKKLNLETELFSIVHGTQVVYLGQELNYFKVRLNQNGKVREGFISATHQNRKTLTPCSFQDADGDGVSDETDLCPNEKGTVTNNGCPDSNKPFTLTNVDTRPFLGECQDQKTEERRQTCTENRLRSFIQRNLEYPQAAEKEGILGTVQMSFVVETDGSIGNIKAENDIGGGCAVEAVRVFNKLASTFKWVPAKSNGKNVRVHYRIPVTFKADFVEPEMVLVPAGSFQMGCDEKRDGDCQDEEKPLHEVRLDAFYLGKYEVTQAQWRAVMGSDPPELEFKGCDQCPVVGASWKDVQKFLQKLNEKTGKRYRLPTEAEWEYAARGGDQRDDPKQQASPKNDYRYAGSNKLDEVAWYSGNSDNKTHPVGGKRPNGLGIYDMSGNVWEWCSDMYDDRYYQNFVKGGADNPKGPAGDVARVFRGGSYLDSASYCRPASRNWSSSVYRVDFLGFRLALPFQ